MKKLFVHNATTLRKAKKLKKITIDQKPLYEIQVRLTA